MDRGQRDIVVAALRETGIDAHPDPDVSEMDDAIEAVLAAGRAIEAALVAACAQHDADMARFQELVSEKQALWGPIWEEALRSAADPRA